MGSPKNLHATVVERWGTGIVSGEIAPGTVISTQMAAEQFGVSRGVIREAVRVLESKGLVNSRQRVGVTVQSPQHWDPYDARVLGWRLAGPQRKSLLTSLSQLRAAVEPNAARLAAGNATGEQCGRLAEAYVGMVATARNAQADDYLRHDMAFHRVVLEASGNEFFAGLGGVVDAVLEGRTHHDLMPKTANTVALRLHGDLVAAVQASDSDAAYRAALDIVEESERAVRTSA
jgi:DNA-binding FadR family transcriptional regulator